MKAMYDAVIIGAGPAGLNAATTVAKAGGSVLVVDENPAPGGQYFRSPLPPLRHRAKFMRYIAAGISKRVDAAIEAGVEFALSYQVFDVSPGFRLGLSSITGSGIEWVAAKTVLVATGATEIVHPFCGWTLPGVMTIGAAQNLWKSQGLPPGRRIVVAGSGPFLWLVAQQMIRAGMNVVSVIESASIRGSVGFGRRSWREPLMALLGASYLARILTSKSRFLRGWQIKTARGTQKLTHVEVQEISTGRLISIECDALCISSGLVPSTAMVQILDCETALDAASLLQIPVVNELMETSVRGLFAAGETLGIGGEPVASAEGMIAGFGIAAHLGLTNDASARAEARKFKRIVVRRRPIIKDMLAVYKDPRVTEEIADETIVCRCEEVTAAEVRAALAMGDSEPDIIKSRTRAGMGLCQGRMCNLSVLRMASVANADSTKLGFKGRLPVKPILVSDLIAAHRKLAEKEAVSPPEAK